MSNPVQTWAGSPTDTTTVTSTAGSLPVTGHGVVVAIAIKGPTSDVVTGVTDNQSPSNTYTRDYSVNSQAMLCEYWRCNSVTVNQSTFVVTAALSTSFNGVMFGAELSGLNGLDQTGSNTSGTSSMSLTVTDGSANTNATDFVMALYNGQNSSAIGLGAPTTGYTQIGLLDGSGSGYGGNVECAYKVTSSVETSSATWASTSNGYIPIATIASFSLMTVSGPASPLLYNRKNVLYFT